MSAIGSDKGGGDGPLVSIGVPVYNGEKFLAASLDSILAQTYSNFELVIGDNASTDGTETICKAYAARDSRIQYLRNPSNLGAAENYNLVFHKAHGDFFKWAAHDDLIRPAFLSECVKVLRANHAAVLAFPETVLIDEDGGVLELYPNHLHLTSASAAERFRQCISRPATMCTPVFGLWRRGALGASVLIGKYPHSDQVLLAQLSMVGGFHEVSQPLMLRRIHPQASRQANTNERAVNAWFGASHGLVLPPTLNLTLQYLKCVLGSNMRVGDKLSCFGFTLRRFLRSRKQLKREVRHLFFSGN